MEKGRRAGEVVDLLSDSMFMYMSIKCGIYIQGGRF